jgi:putative endonuclease
MRQFYVYILASRSNTLYVGVTSDLVRRMYEHRRRLVPGFTSKYNITRLVYFETCSDPTAAIAREKQLKKWSRRKKVGLIESENPHWYDLSSDWDD